MVRTHSSSTCALHFHKIWAINFPTTDVCPQFFDREPTFILSQLIHNLLIDIDVRLSILERVE